MKLSLLTWNSQNINDGTILKSYIPVGQMANLSSNAVTVNRAQDFPFLSTTVLSPHVFVIGVQVEAGYNINTARELIKQYFNIMDSQRHNLIAQDENDSNRQYYKTGFPIRVAPDGERPNSFFVTFQVEYPYWRLVTATADSWDITASGDSDVVANIGNIKVKPVFTITPTATKTAGLQYRLYVPVYSNLDKSFTAPLEITNGGLDVQTLIDANKMQATGADFRVWNNGGFSDRWFNGMDSDSDPALCWVNFNLSPRSEGTISVAVDSDDTTLSFAETRDNLSFLRNLKSRYNNTIYIDSEAMTYSDSDVDLIAYTVSNVARAGKDTTAAGHVLSSTARHIENDLWLMYGDSDMTAQDVNDDNKPIFALSSTNLAWSYTNYFDASSNRPGAWKSEIQSTKNNLSYTFTANQNTFADPSTKLGLAMVNGGDFQVMNEAGVLDWLFLHPAGVTNVYFSGDEYHTGSWPAIAGLQYLEPRTAWFSIDSGSISAGSDSSTWNGFDSYDIALPGTYEAIRFAFDGQLDSVINEKAMIQFDTITTSFDSDNTPTIAVGAETAINFFDFTLTNSTTGEYIKVKTPCPVNTALTIDCENKKAYLADGTPVNVILSSSREAWLDLSPGNNSLNFVDAGTTTITIVITHRDRVL